MILKSKQLPLEKYLLGRARGRWNAGNILHLDLGSGYTRVYICKIHWVVHLKLCTLCIIHPHNTFLKSHGIKKK